MTLLAWLSIWVTVMYDGLFGTRMSMHAGVHYPTPMYFPCMLQTQPSSKRTMRHHPRVLFSNKCAAVTGYEGKLSMVFTKYLFMAMNHSFG
jgi:hypothetical protein